MQHFHEQPSIPIAPMRSAAAVLNQRDPMSYDTFTFEMPPEALEVAAARASVRDHLLAAGVDVDTMYLVAFTEVVMNAADEHRRRGVDRPVVITVEADDHVVEVADRGFGYDPADRAARGDVDDGGFGLDLAEAGAPGLRWATNDHGGTTFTLPHRPPTAVAPNGALGQL